jgi:hypothetical protein
MNDYRGTFVGQVERDPEGILWAVLYHCDTVITREQVKSLRKGKRRVADLVMAAADNYPVGVSRPAPTHLNRLVEQRISVPRRRPAHVS